MLGMYEEQFAVAAAADGDLPAIPEEVVAGLNTHDMPTFAAFWAGQPAAVRSAYRAHLGVADDDVSPVLHAALGRLGRSDARVVSITLEDLWLEREPQNVPGTDVERPNWRRRMAVAAEDIASDERVRAGIATVARARRLGRQGNARAARA
jgi:4-alpha-glucanotransferase